MSAPAWLAALLDAGAYPHPCADIELVETHISWVVLTGEYAYKLKKPVDFGFLDFTTLELRRHYCAEELRLNAAFAPELYLGVSTIAETADGRVRVDAPGAVIEYAVRMRQFDRACELDRVLDRGELDVASLRAFGANLCAIHAAARVVDAFTENAADVVLAPMIENDHALADVASEPSLRRDVRRVHTWTLATHARLRTGIEARYAAGMFRECHGDLHLANLVTTPAGIQAFDCIEFSAALREIDPISDVAFLFMDCAVRDRADLAFAFLDAYLDAGGDYDGAAHLRFYAVYRAMVRAKITALAEDGQAEGVRRYVTWACGNLVPASRCLVLMCGVSGSGKSWLAERLVPRLQAVRLRSDVIRREAVARADAGDPGERYSPERRDAVYTEALALTRSLLDAGERVVVDATFMAAAQRERFAALARARDMVCIVVHCTAEPACLRERVATRAADGADPSEATVAVLERQLETFAAPGAGECAITVRTDGRVDVDAVAADILALSV